MKDDYNDSKGNAVVDLALRLDKANKANAQLVLKVEQAQKALIRCRSVFVGWLEDADPRGELVQGESADRDAAVLMLDLINETLRQTEL